MARPLLFCVLFALLSWSVVAAFAAPEAPPSALSPLPLRLSSYTIDPSWSAGSGGRRLVLQGHVLLDVAPDDWVQVSALIPDGYRAGERGPGEWVPFYFLTHSRRVVFDLDLQPTDDEGRTVSFPVLIQSGGRSAWLEIYLKGSGADFGYASAIVQTDASGQPVWFVDRQSPAALSGDLGSYWYFATSVSEALAFVGEMLDLDLHTPAYFTVWCGVGLRPGTLQDLLWECASRAGCEATKVGEREYDIDFADTYVGAPDASWFAVRQADLLRVHADGASAFDLVPAVVECLGATMEPSSALSGSTITSDWMGSPSFAIEAVCSSARPALAWTEHDGVFSFTLRNGD
jgi:hypothetical protein